MIRRAETVQEALSTKTKVYRVLWNITWLLCARWLPRRFGNRWKNRLLRFFGADVSQEARVYSSAKIYDPRNLKMYGLSIIGPNVEVYNVGMVTLENHAKVSQGSYLCTASHNINDPKFPLVFKPITIQEEAWVTAHCIISPGVTVGRGSVVAIGSVCVKDVEPWTVVGGNPAVFIKKREIS